MSPATLVFAQALLALLLRAQSAGPQVAIELPAGPACSAFAQSEQAGGKVSVVPFLEVPAAFSDETWNSVQVWSEWLMRVRRAAASADPKAAARDHAWLACFALQSGRTDQAWDHFASAPAQPGALRALLPLFFLGNAPQDPTVPDWMTCVDGQVLRPALPPASLWSRDLQRGTGRLERRAMRATGLPVGGARIALTIAVEYDGIQIDLVHESGPSVALEIEVPVPAEFELRALMLDWQRQGPQPSPGQRVPASQVPSRVKVELGTQTPERSVYAQLAPRDLALNSTRMDQLPAAWRAQGMRLVCEMGDPLAARLAAFAAAMGSELGLECRLEQRSRSAARSEFGGAEFELFAGPTQSLRLAHWMGQLERRAAALARPQ